MRQPRSTSSPINAIATHAPWLNLVTAAMTKTIADSDAPTALISMLLRQYASRWRDQWTTIPAWERVMATNTPTAYRGMSALVRPPNTASSAPAASASASVPLLNARRSPSRKDAPGACPFRAMNDSRRGKPLNAVLAATSSTSAGVTCTYPYSGPDPKLW